MPKGKRTNQYDTDWSDEVIGQLRALWAEGHSTVEIGRRLGTTKNSVLGKAHRLDLPGRQSPILRDRSPRQPKVPRASLQTIPPLKSFVRETDSASPDTRKADERRAVAETETEPDLPVRKKRGVRIQRALAGEPPVQPEATAAHDRRVAGITAAELSQRQVVGNASANAKRGPTLPPLSSLEAIAPATVFKPRRLTQCCWPIGEPRSPAFRFCDAPAERGKPYCKEHRGVAWKRVRDRREDAADRGASP
jgi:GcrA cell cycle regulator